RSWAGGTGCGSGCPRPGPRSRGAPRTGRMVRQVAVTVSDTARTDATLRHPHLIQLYDAGELAAADGSRQRYVGTALGTGTGLDERLAKGPMPWPTALRTGAEIAGALAAVHGHGLALGDLQPADVVLTPAGAKLTRRHVVTVAPDAACEPPDADSA